MKKHSTLVDHPDIMRVLKQYYPADEINSMRICHYRARKVKNRMGEIEDDGLRLRIFGKEGVCEMTRLKTAPRQGHL